MQPGFNANAQSTATVQGLLQGTLTPTLTNLCNQGIITSQEAGMVSQQFSYSLPMLEQAIVRSAQQAGMQSVTAQLVEQFLVQWISYDLLPAMRQPPPPQYGYPQQPPPGPYATPGMGGYGMPQQGGYRGHFQPPPPPPYGYPQQPAQYGYQPQPQGMQPGAFRGGGYRGHFANPPQVPPPPQYGGGYMAPPPSSGPGDIYTRGMPVTTPSGQPVQPLSNFLPPPTLTTGQLPQAATTMVPATQSVVMAHKPVPPPAKETLKATAPKKEPPPMLPIRDLKLLSTEQIKHGDIIGQMMTCEADNIAAKYRLITLVASGLPFLEGQLRDLVDTIDPDKKAQVLAIHYAKPLIIEADWQTISRTLDTLKKTVARKDDGDLGGLMAVMKALGSTPSSISKLFDTLITNSINQFAMTGGLVYGTDMDPTTIQFEDLADVNRLLNADAPDGDGMIFSRVAGVPDRANVMLERGIRTFINGLTLLDPKKPADKVKLIRALENEAAKDRRFVDVPWCELTKLTIACPGSPDHQEKAAIEAAVLVHNLLFNKFCVMLSTDVQVISRINAYGTVSLDLEGPVCGNVEVIRQPRSLFEYGISMVLRQMPDIPFDLLVMPNDKMTYTLIGGHTLDGVLCVTTGDVF